jgi:putative ABC transport system permease protein
MGINALTENNDSFPFYNPSVNYSNVFSAMFVMVFLGLIIGLIPAQKSSKNKTY